MIRDEASGASERDFEGVERCDLCWQPVPCEHVPAKSSSSATAQERAALGRIRTSLYARILDYREQREKAERSLENLARLEASALEEARAIDLMLDLTNPYGKGSRG